MRLFVLSCCVLPLAISSMTNAADKTDKHPIYGQTMTSLEGKAVDLAKYRGQVMLIVNTASECGATPQYDPLQGLHEKYAGKGLAVVGFPCNQFGAQEPGSSQDIAKFCQSNYGVSFDMFEKIDVNGKEAAPLYAYLTSDTNGLDDTGKVRWNFEKFLIGRDGRVLKRFRTGVQPDSPEVIAAIEAALK